MVERRRGVARPTSGDKKPPRPQRSRTAREVVGPPTSANLTRALDYAHGRAEQAEAERKMGPEEAAAIVAARSGDDSALFPYTPTPSINPPRPRTQAAGYSKDTQTLRVKFREGAVYEYYGVPPNVWRNFLRVKSPGKAINRVLNNYDYSRRLDLES